MVQPRSCKTAGRFPSDGPTSDFRGRPVCDLRFELRLEVGDPQHLSRGPVLVQELVQRIVDVAVAEEHDRILIAAAFSNTPEVPAVFGGLIIASALLIYAASWAIGWAVRGFMGEAPVAPAPASLGAAAVPLAPSVVIAAKRAKRPPLVGIRGWLILPSIGTVITPFTIAVTMVSLFDVISKATD